MNVLLGTIIIRTTGWWSLQSLQEEQLSRQGEHQPVTFMMPYETLPIHLVAPFSGDSTSRIIGKGPPFTRQPAAMQPGLALLPVRLLGNC